MSSWRGLTKMKMYSPSYIYLNLCLSLTPFFSGMLFGMCGVVVNDKSASMSGEMNWMGGLIIYYILFDVC